MKKKTQKELIDLVEKYLRRLSEHQNRLFLQFANEVVKVKGEE